MRLKKYADEPAGIHQTCCGNPGTDLGLLREGSRIRFCTTSLAQNGIRSQRTMFLSTSGCLSRDLMIPAICWPWLAAAGISAVLLTACQNESQAPPSRPEPSANNAPEVPLLAPIDLIYVCGNKFLATNATDRPVEVTYRVAGTDESGTLILRESSGRDEGHSETELGTRERGVVELYQGD